MPRTIRREQDARPRELSERTGRSLSELVRGRGETVLVN